MLRKYHLWAIAALFLVWVSLAQAADSAPANAIAIVNIQHLMHDSTAAQNVREQMESKYKSFQSEMSKKESQFQKEEQELRKQQSVLSKSAFEEKVQAFRKKVDGAQKEAQNKKSLLDNASARAWTEIQKTVSDIVADLAKEKGFLVALSSETPGAPMLYADPKLDITDEVLKRLNQKLPKLDVKFEAASGNSKKDDE